MGWRCVFWSCLPVAIALSECRCVSDLNPIETLTSTCCPLPPPSSLLSLKLKIRGGVGLIQRHRIDRILDNFFISRISLRFLVDTYISSKKNKPGFSGLIESECSPVLAREPRRVSQYLCSYIRMLHYTFQVDKRSCNIAAVLLYFVRYTTPFKSISDRCNGAAVLPIFRMLHYIFQVDKRSM